MPGHVRAIMFVAIIIGALSIGVGAAHAAGWYPPVADGAMLLGFGAAYAGGTHRGVDISAGPGSGVAAPSAGTVLFAGQVPADGGGTCTAVTLELADGRRMSLLPLEAAEVVAGESVEAGQALGQVAATGDDSSAAPHVHVSLRSGELYLDPGELLGTTVADDVVAPAAPAPAAEGPSGTGGSTAAPAPAHSAAPATSPAPALDGSAAAAISAVGAPALPERAMPAVARMQEVQSAGVPEPSTLAPAHWRGTARATPVIAPIDSRVATGAGLACAMVAAAVGIVLSRRTAAVRAN